MTRLCLVVEDESPLGEMICDNLDLEGWETELLGDGAAALERLNHGDIDVVILDIMLPLKSGFEVLEEMRRRGDHTPVLILSARANDQDRVRGLELGADDYLGKPFVLRELLLRVGALLRRTPTAGGEERKLIFGGNQILLRSHSAVTWDGREVALTSSEVKLLRLLANQPNEVVSRAECVRHLFGPATPPSARTLDNLVLNLRKMFERDRQSPEHLQTVRGVGLRLRM